MKFKGKGSNQILFRIYICMKDNQPITSKTRLPVFNDKILNHLLTLKRR